MQNCHWRLAKMITVIVFKETENILTRRRRHCVRTQLSSASAHHFLPSTYASKNSFLKLCSHVFWFLKGQTIHSFKYFLSLKFKLCTQLLSAPLPQLPLLRFAPALVLVWVLAPLQGHPTPAAKWLLSESLQNALRSSKAPITFLLYNCLTKITV